MREREHFIDVVKVIGIFLVICGHYVYDMHIPMDNDGKYLWDIAISITLFHMPMFFIISGYLHKTPETWKRLLSSIAQRLLIPYVLICLTALFVGVVLQLLTKGISLTEAAHETIHNICGIISGGDFPHTRISYSGAMWFVYSLIIIRVIYYGIERLFLCTQTSKKMIKTVVGIGCIGGLYIGNRLPFRLDSSIVGLLFFIIGDLGKDIIKQMTQSQQFIKLLYMLVAIVVLVVCAYFNIDYENGKGNSINVVSFGPYPLLFLLSGIFGSLLIIILSSLIKVRRVSFWENLSNSNIIILGFHSLIMMSIYITMGCMIKWYMSMVICIITFVICAFLGEIFKKYAPAYVGWR